jgi:hypothetical protein
LFRLRALAMPVREARGIGFERQVEGAAEEADRVIVARQRDHFDYLRLVEMGGEFRPGFVTYGAAVDQIVDGGQQRPFVGRPAGRIGRSVDGRRDPFRVEADLFREEGDVDAPFIFGPESCRGAVDHDLALAEREGAPVEQAAGKHLPEDARVACHRPEQVQRRDARRHGARKSSGDLGRVRLFGGRDAGHAGLQTACYIFRSNRKCGALQKM